MRSLILGSGLVLASCGIFGTKEHGKKMTEVDSKLAGEWVSNCSPYTGIEKVDLYSKMEYHFSALGDFDKIELYSTNQNCSEPGLVVRVTGTYAALGKHPQQSDIDQINETINKVVVTLHSPTLLNTFTMLSLCGKGDWVAGAEVDLTGKNCAGVTYNKGDVVFDVYKVQEGARYFGHKFFFLARDDADGRPKNINTDVTYTKK